MLQYFPVKFKNNLINQSRDIKGGCTPAYSPKLAIPQFKQDAGSIYLII